MRVTLLAVTILAFGTAGSLRAADLPAQLDPASLLRAEAIRYEVGHRYSAVPGRRLVVTESTSTGVVDSITLMTDWLEPPRVVPAGNGIYFALCTARARCPYAPRSAAWRRSAFLPRRIALELAARAFLETTASLVVVSLPTERPSWVVFERDELSTVADMRAVLGTLSAAPGRVDEVIRQLVDRLTQPCLYRPLPIVPPPPGTIIAVRVAAS
jgi:hypothetical protein